MSSPINNDDPDSGLRTYSAVLPDGVTFGATPVICLGGPGPRIASALPPGVRLNPPPDLNSGRDTNGATPNTGPTNETSTDPNDDVKPDLLIDPSDQPPKPPDRTKP